MKEQEDIILANSVGTITKQTVKIKPVKGGFLTIGLPDIVAIKYALKRKFHYAALFLLFGLGALFVAFFPGGDQRLSLGSFLVPAVLIIAGIANLLGYYTLELQTKKGSIKMVDVEFNKLKDGKAFIETLEKMIAEQS